MAWGYSRSLTVTSSSTLLPSTQTNFPVLVYISHATLKTVANSGHINNTVTAASGPAVTMPADLIFTSDSGGTTKIAWEVESYDATNGILWAWVVVASCALSTVFYCFYGDSAVSTAQNTGSYVPANVWDANYVGVWHLATNSSALVLSDSTSNARTLTNVNTATAVTGQVDGGVGVASASSQELKRVTNIVAGSTAFTQSAWVKNTTFPTAYNTVVTQNNNAVSAHYFDLHIKSTGKLGMFVGSPNVSYDGTGATTLSTGAWYCLAMAYDNSGGLCGYVNGASDKTVAAGGNLAVVPTQCEIGNDLPFTPRHINGSIDEVRLSNIARSANWVTAEYNSQNDPSTFVAVGAEVASLAIAALVASYRRRRIL